jgi:hypothetical protein
MRHLPAISCALCVLACSTTQEKPSTATATYACELRDERGLTRTPWRNPPELAVGQTVNQGAPLEGLPREVANAPLNLSIVWSAELPNEDRAWFWSNEVESLVRYDYAEAWYFAFADAQGNLTFGSERVAAWSETSNVQLGSIAVSATGQIALAYRITDQSFKTSHELLLIDSDGTVLEQTMTGAPGPIDALQATSSGEFAMLVVRRTDYGSSITFATLSEREGFRERPAPIFESGSLAPYRPLHLISADDGYRVAWENEHDERESSGISFRHLDEEGEPLGDERHLLPPPEAPFQGS